jgi:O-antigen ligase
LVQVPKIYGFTASEELPRVGSFFLFFALATFVGSAWGHLEEHDVSRVFQLASIILSIFFLSNTSAAKDWLITVAVVLVVTFGVIAGRWGSIEAVHLSSLVCLGIVWSRSLRNRPEHHLLTCLVGLCAAYTFVLLPRWIAFVVEGLPFYAHEFFPAFSNQRFFGHWVTLSLPLVVLARERWSSAPTLARWLDLLAALWVAFAVASGTRGTWMALTLITLLLPLAGFAGRRLARGMMRAALLGVGAYALMFWLIPLLVSGQSSPAGLSRFTEGGSLSLRDVIWSEAWRGILAHPLMGLGPMMLAATSNGVAAHPHSFFLQIASEWGVPVALGVVGVFARAGWIQLQLCRRDGDPLRTALLAAIGAGLLHAQVDGVLVMPFGQTLFVLLCAWIASMSATEVSTVPHSTVGRYGFRLRGLLLVLVFAQVWLIWPELTRLKEWEQETHAAGGGGLYLPRYWAQGTIPREPQPLFRRL